MHEDISKRVRAQYTEHPFPPPCRRGTYSRQAAYLRGLLEDVAHPYVLDAGCGTGAMVVDFARAMPDAQFVGVDLTPASVEVARAYAREAGVRNATFHVGRVEDLGGESFDLVHSWGVLHHTPWPEDSFSAVWRATKPGGWVRVGVYGEYGNHIRRCQQALLRGQTPDLVRAWAAGDATCRESYTQPPVDLAADAWVVDEFLHEHEHHIRLAELAEWSAPRTAEALTDYDCNPISLFLSSHNTDQSWVREMLDREVNVYEAIDLIARPYWLGWSARKA